MEVKSLGGFPVSLMFSIADCTGSTTVAGKLASGQGAEGFLVPANHVFRPLLLSVRANEARTAGTSTAKVTDNGTAVTGGPETVLNATNTQVVANVARNGAVEIAAGHLVGVSAVNASFAGAASPEMDVVLLGELIPV